MSVTKTKISWITGLLIALLTALSAYLNTSCRVSKTTFVEIDSTYIGKMKIQKSFDAKLQNPVQPTSDK